ncbi:M15 family metallopeptidase [Ensifer sp. HO-A22]|uniref:M15 family metallopeptidase n=1 Tax=Ensifer oleiphilus TaxID=2742698 RepID=A0A7Y6UPA8_9HYPH|nr:M15 family metallopeptidase [Ensifer oleiphilus]
MFAVIGSARGTQQLIDSAISIQNALKVAGVEGENLKKVYDSLFASAQKNAAPIESLVSLYSRLALSQKELGVSQQELLNFTDKISLALRVGGTTAAQASGALLQLSQALGGGTVRAEEFNSILEGAPTIVQAVAVGLKEAGGSVSQLRKLMIDGKVSSQAFFRAFEAGSGTLEDRVSGAESTISQRLVRLQNVLVDAAGKFNESTKAGEVFGTAIDDLAKDINDINFDSLIEQIQGVVKALNDGYTDLQDWSKAFGEATGLNNIGRYLAGPTGTNDVFAGTPLAGSFVIKSLDTPEQRALALTEKRLEIEKKIEELRGQIDPANQLGAPLVQVLKGQIADLQAELAALPKMEEVAAKPAFKYPRRPVSLTPRTIKPISIDNYKVESDKEDKKAETAAKRAKAAYDSLIKSADDRIGQLKLETDLLGQFGVATDAARFRLELLQQSEDKGRSLNAAQRQEIEQKVAAYEKYSQALAEAKLQQDMLDANRMAGLSKIDQNIIETQRGRGLPEDVNSASGRALRQQINREALAGDVSSFLSEFSGGLLEGGKSLGEAFADAVKNAAADAMQKSLDSLFSQIGNALASAVFGPVAGGTTGSIASSALSAFPAAPSSLASAFVAPVGAVTRGALPAAGTSKTGIGLSTISTAGGLTADVNAKFASQFQSLVNDLEATGYQIKSIGGYNHRNIAGTNKLSNHAYGNAIDINPQANPMGRNLVTDMPTGVSAIAARNGFNWGGDWKSKKDAMHFEISQAKSAGEALEKLAGASTETTKGLSSLATNLTSAGGGGGSSWLSFLSGTAFSGSKQLAASGGIGLFDKGGYTGAGGKYTPAGIVHKGEYVFDAAATSRIGVPTLERLRGYANGGLVGAPRAPRLNGRPSPANSNAQPGILQVHVSGASGDDHVRTLVKQGVGEALAAQNKNMERGGFGTMQARYGNQKG